MFTSLSWREKAKGRAVRNIPFGGRGRAGKELFSQCQLRGQREGGLKKATEIS